MPESYSINDFGFRVITLKSPVWAVHGQRLFENAGACRQDTWHRHGHMNRVGSAPCPISTGAAPVLQQSLYKHRRQEFDAQQPSTPAALTPAERPHRTHPEHGSNPNFPGPQQRSPPAHAPAAASQVPESAPWRGCTSKVRCKNRGRTLCRAPQSALNASKQMVKQEHRHEYGSAMFGEHGVTASAASAIRVKEYRSLRCVHTSTPRAEERSR